MFLNNLRQLTIKYSTISLIGAIQSTHAELAMSSNTINPETAISYAALILADEGLEVTPDKLQTLLKAAGLDIEPIWSTVFAKALEGKDVKQILTTVQVSGSTGGKVDQGEKAQGNQGDEAGIVEVCSDGGSDSDECDLPLGLFD